MNKFEALKQFQSWPPEWQRLCAECWIETGEVEPATLCDIEARFRNGGPVSSTFDRPKAAKVAPSAHLNAVRRAARPSTLSSPPGSGLQLACDIQESGTS